MTGSGSYPRLEKHLEGYKEVVGRRFTPNALLANAVQLDLPSIGRSGAAHAADAGLEKPRAFSVRCIRE